MASNTGMTENKRALVIGGSVSGLLAGLLLRQRGWTVNVYERVESELAGRGAGIVAQPELIARLRRLGLNTAGLGVEITTRKMFEASGRLIGACEYPQVLTAWERVYRMLRDAFPPGLYHRGKGLVSFEQTSRSVTVQFTDGTAEEADLLVGAYLQATQTMEERALSERHSNAQAVLTETAVVDFLYA